MTDLVVVEFSKGHSSVKVGVREQTNEQKPVPVIQTDVHVVVRLPTVYGVKYFNNHYVTETKQ